MKPTIYLLLALTASVAAQTPPNSITLPPPAQQAILTAVGKGVQIYACQQAAGGPQWVFQAPEATLTDASGKVLGTHGAGPIWISQDGSSVKGEVLQRFASPEPTAIPWLLLKAASVSGSGVLSQVEFVRRSDTHGGNAPAAGCDAQHLNATVRIPYTATYTFYSSQSSSALPGNYQSIFNNATVEIFRAHYGPHEKVPVHDHPAVATVFVYLNNSGQVRIDHLGEEPVVRPPTVKGAYRIAPALAERHSVENLSDIPSDFFRVELKQIDLKLPEPFRGKAPQSLAQTQDAIEFINPNLEVERIICTGVPQCPIKPSTSPSVLIAFTPLDLATGSQVKTEKLDLGSIHWLPAMQTAAITPEAASPAHLLRILLPSAPK